MSVPAAPGGKALVARTATPWSVPPAALQRGQEWNESNVQPNELFFTDRRVRSGSTEPVLRLFCVLQRARERKRKRESKIILCC